MTFDEAHELITRAPTDARERINRAGAEAQAYWSTANGINTDGSATPLTRHELAAGVNAACMVQLIVELRRSRGKSR